MKQQESLDTIFLMLWSVVVAFHTYTGGLSTYKYLFVCFRRGGYPLRGEWAYGEPYYDYYVWYGNSHHAPLSMVFPGMAPVT